MTDRGSTAMMVTAAVLSAAIVAGCGDWSSSMVTDGPSARAEARTTLYKAAAAPQGTLRAQALESLAAAEGQAAGPTFLRALDDPAVAVRFVAAMAVGDVAYAPAAEKLRRMATAENTDPNVRCGVVYALHRLGDNTHMSLLGAMLYARSPEVRANAALVMGKVGMPAAIGPLRSRLSMESNPGVRLQLAESLASLGEQRSYGLLENYARVGEPHERMAAVQALGRTKSLRAKGSVFYAIGSQQPPPLRLVAAGALAQMGDHRWYKLAVEAARDPERFTQKSYDRKVTVSPAQMYQIQTLAALALTEMNKPEAVDVLVGLLNSPDPTVRVAAARGILILLRRFAPPAPQPEPPVEPTMQPPPTRQAEPSENAGEPALRTAPMKD